MALRKIIEINEEKCDGCGNCVIGCAEGALRIVDGKARLISDVYCDGLGACIGECPRGALTIVEREAPEFDEKAVEAMLKGQHKTPAHGVRPIPLSGPSQTLACGCPSSLARELTPSASAVQGGQAPASALRNWPVQLHLVPVRAPYFKDASLLIAADCAGVSLTNLHQRYLPGKTLIVACPKLDDAEAYEAKLAEIFSQNTIRDITILYMTVPCCGGLIHLVRRALERSGRSIPVRLVQVDMNGEIADDRQVKAA